MSKQKWKRCCAHEKSVGCRAVWRGVHGPAQQHAGPVVETAQQQPSIVVYFFSTGRAALLLLRCKKIRYQVQHKKMKIFSINSPVRSGEITPFFPAGLVIMAKLRLLLLVMSRWLHAPSLLLLLLGQVLLRPLLLLALLLLLELLLLLHHTNATKGTLEARWESLGAVLLFLWVGEE